MDSIFKTLFEADKYFRQLFEKLDYSSKTIQNKLVEDCKLKHCNFDGAELLKCKFIDCESAHCTLNTVTLTDSVFSNVVFDSSKLMGVNGQTVK